MTATHDRRGHQPQGQARARERLREIGGGVVVFHKARKSPGVELPIARADVGRAGRNRRGQAERMVSAMREMGCRSTTPTCQHSSAGAWSVIPELRISDIGLVDVRSSRR